jgi:leucyl aminopeptidase
VNVSATTSAPVDTEADTVAIGVFDGKGIAHDVEDGSLQALLDSGEARTKHGHLALAHAAGKRWIVCGLGSRDDFDAEGARRAAATVLARARELGTKTLCWELPHRLDDLQAGGFVEGTLLASYRFEVYKPASPDGTVEALIVSDHDDRGAAVHRADVVARAQNRARELMDLPANAMTPTALADAAREIAGVEVTVDGRDALIERDMGAFAAVAQGSRVEPALITIRYDGGGDGPLIGLVGKAVTHDTGGLSIKPAANMHRMKYDMGGGAAVLGAVAAAAELQLPVRLVAVIGATENVVGADAMKPGDIVRAADGTTIEVNNTDAEGRLVLCDCLWWAREQGAERLVDVATLTGGIVTALGDVYAGVFANDEPWHDAVMAAAARSGERLWRLPLDPAYAEQIEGRFAQIVNSTEARTKGHAIMGAEFLHRFAGDVPWAHLDIAGVAYDWGRPYANKGASGFGVRLLTELLAA